MDQLRFDDNDLLFGADPTRGIVAAELAGRFIRLFIRDKTGVRFRDDLFRPFILLTDSALLDGFSAPMETKRLSGEGEFRILVLFRDWHDCLGARDFLVRQTGRSASSPGAPYLYISDPVHQHLLLTGITLFKGLPFEAVSRLALDIETACAPGYEFSNPERDEDRIISIAVVTSGGREEVISGRELPEREMIDRLTQIIRQEDPDVIEGHNLFRFDLEYLRIRAERSGTTLPWGRDGSRPRVHRSRFTVAERIVDYPRWDIYGRQIIDTYFLLLVYDVSTRELESLGLKAAARHFGLAAPDRVYLEGDGIDTAFAEDPAALAAYNLDDARETSALARLLAYPFFLQSRIFPYSFQNCAVRGTATKINSLFLREYLRRTAAIPQPGGEGSFEGGHTEIRITGVVGPIVHCDVASLYPSLILACGISPVCDRLGIFLPMLAALRDFRLTAKKHARVETDPGRREYFQALQQTFKVLINSFYGYLGTTVHHFADTAAAAEVALRGREVIGAMLVWLEEHGARPVEVDTDGIYFIPPPGFDSPEEEAALVRELSGTLPAGIEVELDGRYRSMFSYKMKNYALEAFDGTITLRGSALRSRGMERYLQDFLRETIRLLLAGAGDKVDHLYNDYLGRLREHRFPIAMLAKTETLRESPEAYRQKVRQGKRQPAAAYELALASGREFRAGDQIRYYVTDCGKGKPAYARCRPVSAHDPTHPDEDLVHYAARLKQLREKFAPFLPGEKSLFD